MTADEQEAFEEKYVTEVLCDALAGIDRADTKGTSRFVQAVREVFLFETGIDIDALLNGSETATETAQEAAESKANPRETRNNSPPERYSIDGEQFAEDKYYARQIDKWDSLTAKKITVGTIRPDSALNKVGLPASKMYFDVSKIKKQMETHNDHLSEDTLKGIPDLLNDPIVIAEYKGTNNEIVNTVSVYGYLFEKTYPVVVGVVMHKDRSGNNIITNIRTIHARSNFAKQINDDSVLYLNEDKKKTRKWFQVCGILNVPLEGTKFEFIRRISYVSNDVKSEKIGQYGNEL